jgi:hypothetical protein
VDKEETDEIGTSILRQVGSSWPAIKARLISTSDEIIFSQRAKSVVVLRPQHVQSSSPNQELAVHRMFLAKLTSLIAAMSEGSGEFITDRFKNEVWPVISMQLACLVDKQDRTNRLLESSQEKRWNVILVTKSNAVMTTFQDSEKSLVSLRLSVRENQIFLAGPSEPSTPWLTDRGRPFLRFTESLKKATCNHGLTCQSL